MSLNSKKVNCSLSIQSPSSNENKLLLYEQGMTLIWVFSLWKNLLICALYSILVIAYKSYFHRLLQKHKKWDSLHIPLALMCISHGNVLFMLTWKEDIRTSWDNNFQGITPPQSLIKSKKLIHVSDPLWMGINKNWNVLSWGPQFLVLLGFPWKSGSFKRLRIYDPWVISTVTANAKHFQNLSHA